MNRQGENQERTLIEGAAAVGEQLAGKYMTFKLANEEYGLEILKVREIIGLMDITRVPCTQEFMSGVINLRGKVIPVIDLRLKFGMERCQVTDQTVIIVVQYTLHGRNMTMGLLVTRCWKCCPLKPRTLSRRRSSAAARYVATSFWVLARPRSA